MCLAPAVMPQTAGLAAQGGDYSVLTRLQELRISTGDDVVGFHLSPHGLPPSLRRLRVHHGRKPAYTHPKLVILPVVSMSEGTIPRFDGVHFEDMCVARRQN